MEEIKSPYAFIQATGSADEIRRRLTSDKPISHGVACVIEKWMNRVYVDTYNGQRHAVKDYV